MPLPYLVLIISIVFMLGATFFLILRRDHD